MRSLSRCHIGPQSQEAKAPCENPALNVVEGSLTTTTRPPTPARLCEDGAGGASTCYVHHLLFTQTKVEMCGRVQLLVLSHHRELAIFRVAPPENFTSRVEGECAVSSTSYFHHLFPFEISSDKRRVTGAFVTTLSSLSIRRPTTRKQRTVLNQEKGMVLTSYNPSHPFNIEPVCAEVELSKPSNPLKNVNKN